MRRLLIIPAALLVLLGGPVLALESTVPPVPTTDELPVAAAGQTVTDGWKSATTPVDANLVGVSWEGDPSAAFTIEVRHTDGSWSKAAKVEGDSDAQAESGTQDAVGAAADPSTASEPLWIGDDATAVRVTLADGTATNVSVEAVDAPAAAAPSGSAGALVGWLPKVDGPQRYLFGGALLAGAALLVAVAFGWSPWRGRGRALRRTVLAVLAGALVVSACAPKPAPAPPLGPPVQPPMIYPYQWSARQFGTGPVPCTAPQYAPALRFAVVHHTAGSNNYTASQSASIVRGIQSYHMDANGFCDIAYHFLIDKYGQIFVGRQGGVSLPVIGGHAGGFNSGSVGVALLGDFTSIKPTAAQWNALVALLRWRLSVGRVTPTAGFWQTVGSSPCNCQKWPPGTSVFLPNAIVTHRDVDYTSCPGSSFYLDLAKLRTQVQAGIVFPPTTTSTTSTSTTSTSTTTTTTL